jgi:transposase
LKKSPTDAVLLIEDETIIRLYPPLRACWAMRGEQAVVPITGRNAKRVLFGVINPRTGRRILMRAHSMRQEAFQEFLRLLRRRYPGRPILLLLDEASCHTAKASQLLATQLGITPIWLPTQCSELNSMDHLWRELKGKIAANRQFADIDQAAQQAESWVLGLTKAQARCKAGILSKNFWLKDFCQ